MSQTSFIPEPGERALIVGQTGSGKTAFAIWLLQRIPHAPIIIYDTKIEPKFDKLLPNIVVEHVEQIPEALEDEKIDYIIVRPPAELLGEPRELDDYLWFHYMHCHGVPAFIDELVTIQINGKAGKGLMSLMQRGRSKGITTIMCTQRPVRVDRSCVTEASKAYIFRLTDKADKKRLDDVIPNFSALANPPKHGFYFYETGEDHPVLMAPIKLDASLDTGYVDVSQASPDEPGADHAELNSPTKHTWL